MKLENYAHVTAKALRVWDLLRSHFQGKALDLEEPDACPGENDDFMFTWEDDERYFECEIFRTGIIEFFYKDKHSNELADEDCTIETMLGSSLLDKLLHFCRSNEVIDEESHSWPDDIIPLDIAVEALEPARETLWKTVLVPLRRTQPTTLLPQSEHPLTNAIALPQLEHDRTELQQAQARSVLFEEWAKRSRSMTDEEALMVRRMILQKAQKHTANDGNKGKVAGRIENSLKSIDFPQGKYKSC